MRRHSRRRNTVARCRRGFVRAARWFTRHLQPRRTPEFSERARLRTCRWRSGCSPACRTVRRSPQAGCVPAHGLNAQTFWTALKILSGLREPTPPPGQRDRHPMPKLGYARDQGLACTLLAVFQDRSSSSAISRTPTPLVTRAKRNGPSPRIRRESRAITRDRRRRAARDRSC